MEKLIVSASPHLRSQTNTRRVMLDVLLALLPAAVCGVVLFGWRALLVLVACVGSALLSEYVFDLLVKKPCTLGDLSCAVTGLLLGLNLPATTPIWQCVIGAVFAIVVVKCFFGGLGHNFANPAITGRVLLLISFSGTVGGGAVPVLGHVAAGATPLEVLGGGKGTLPSLLEMLLGLRGGAIGETCILALAFGGVYLVLRRVIRWEVPATFIGTVFVLAWILSGSAVTALYHVLAGGLVLGAIFMATDYVTTPLHFWGKIAFAFGCGVITVLIRFFGGYPEGVSFSILLMNILSPYLDRWTTPRPLGSVSGAKKGGKRA